MKEKKKYSVSVTRDTRSKKGDGAEAPLKLLVNINGDRFRVGIDLYATVADFSSAMKVKGGTEATRELRKKIGELAQKAEDILEDMPNPNKDNFIRFFKSEVGISYTKGDVTPHFQQKMDELKAQGSIKYALLMRLTLSSLKAYKNPIMFSDVDEKWLRGYEKKMRDGGATATTISMYLRCLRTIVNRAIKEGIISKNNYGFKNYQVSSSVQSKDVLYPEEIQKIWEYECISRTELRSLSYWKFCYLSAMNFKDFCYLKRKNIQGDFLMFIREKTKNTNRVSGKQVKVAIHPEMQKVIDEYGNKTNDHEAYVFPILNGKTTPTECEKRRDNVQRKVNDKIKEIGQKLDLKVVLRLAVARHSFATTLMLNGTPVAQIGELLGHSNSKTTMFYLHSLPQEHHRQISNTLLPFLNNK